MIPLIFSNDRVFVWDTDDWEVLRKEHRIVGSLVGSLPQCPYQVSHSGLPLSLLPEEATLLLEKSLGKLVTYSSLQPSQEKVSKYEEYLEQNKKEQAEFIIAERKKTVTDMIDRIIEGKKKKQSLLAKRKKTESETNSNQEVLDREEVLKAELQKVEETPLNHSLILTYTKDPWLEENDFEEVSSWCYPSSDEESMKYSVFKDLWQKGFYITCGEKFGGDYLVYPGDPSQFHAHYIVTCVKYEAPLPWLKLAAHCRVSNSTRKTFVIASPRPDSSVKYSSIQFASLRSHLI